MEYKKLYTSYPTNIYKQMITVKVNEHNHALVEFHRDFVDITPDPSELTQLQQLEDYYEDPMNAYFNQYAFALYCASTLCGVTKDHLTRGLPLTQSIYKFHVMYQTKKILYEMRAKTKLDNEFYPLKNPYNKTAYETILNEFNVHKSDIPVIDQPSRGLGKAILKKDGSDTETAGALSLQQYYELPDSPPMPTYSSTGASYYYEDMDLKKFGDHQYAFESQMDKTKSRRPAGDLFNFWQGGDWNQGGGSFATIKYIKQDPVDYNRFIADHPKQVRKDINTERINESIRAYVWSLYAAQAEVLSPYDGPRKLAAQKRFEELIPSTYEWTLEKSISDFQNALKYTEGEINYVVDPGLYMIPNNLLLKFTTVPGWNDRLKVARQLARPGFNPYNVQDHSGVVYSHHSEDEHRETTGTDSQNTPSQSTPQSPDKPGWLQPHRNLPQPTTLGRQSTPGPTSSSTQHTQPMQGTRPTPHRPELRSLPHEKQSDYNSHQGSLLLVSGLMVGAGILYVSIR